MAARELTDEEVFGSARELSDEEVFGQAERRNKVLDVPTHREAETGSMRSLLRRPPNIVRRSQLAAATGGFLSRPVFTAVGGTLGGLAGAPGGPVSAVGGAGLGAAGGSALFDPLENLYRSVRGRPNLNTPLETAKRAAEEGAEDIAFSAGVAGVGPVVKRVIGKGMGILTPGARRLTESAALQGVDLGTAHISPRKLAKGLPKVLGVFPFVGTPLRKGQARVVGQLDTRAAQLLNELAPTATTFDIGKRLTAKAATRYAAFNRLSSTLYRRFADVADNLSVREIVDSGPIKAELAGIAEKAGVEQITLQSGKPMARFGEDVVGKWLSQLSELPERITVRQARGLERELNAILRGAKQGNYDVSRLRGVKGALEEAKATLDVSRLPAEEAKEVLSAWSKANRFFAQTKGMFETATAKKFGRVDRNIFGKQFFKAGSVNEDEVMKAVFQTKSVDGLNDLRRLVGPAEFQKASRKFIETSFNAAKIPGPEGSTVKDMFSAADFEKRLSLGTEEGRAMFKNMLKGSGANPRDWYDFLEVAKKATDITIRDPATYLTRRLVIGGSLVGGMVLGAGKVTLPAAAAITLVSRTLAKGAMNSKNLRDMTRFLSPRAPAWQRRTILMRMLKAPFKEEN